MKFQETELEGVIIIEPQVFSDARGFFLESYHREKYAAGGITATFVQDNHSRSVGGTLRGLHLQRTRLQGKLIRVISGRIYDLAIDLRRGSPSFKRWIGIELSASNFRQLYIPPGFGHGFCVLSEVAEVEYKCTDFYAPEDELTVLWNDPDLGIEWPVSDPLLSAKDRAGKPLSEIYDLLPEYAGY